MIHPGVFAEKTLGFVLRLQKKELVLRCITKITIVNIFLILKYIT